MRIVTTTEHVFTEDRPIFRQLDLLLESGFRYIDFTACCFIGPGRKYGDTIFFSDDWKPWIRDIRAYADKKGIVFTQTHNLMYNYFTGSEESELLNRMMDRVFEACGILGAPLTVVHPIAPPGAAGNIPECLRRNAAFFREKADRAAEHGVQLAVENMIVTRNFDGTTYWRYCSTPEQLIELVDAIDKPNVGFCFDVGHSHYMHENVYESVLKYGRRLISLHIHDNNLSDDQHVAPYSGSLDWDAFLKGLVDVRYAGDFSLESFRSTIRLPEETQPDMLRAMYRLSEWMVRRMDAFRV